MDAASMREAHARAATYWATRSEGLEESYHRIEAGDVERAAAVLIEVGPALAESARAGDLEAALLRVPRDPRLEGLLAETEMFLGRFPEARKVLERITASGMPAERLRARIQLGRIANRLGSYAEARTILDAAVRESETLGFPEVQGEALRALGAVERKLGDLDAAVAHLERAADVLPAGSRERMRALTELGAVLIGRGDFAGAKGRLLEAASSVRRATRDDAAIHSNLGIVLSREGDRRQAAASFERSAESALSAGDMRFASYALANAVDNFLHMELIEAAATHAERALSLANTTGDPLAVSTARANLGLVFAKRREWAKAEEHLLGSVEVIAGLDNPSSLASRYEELAKLYEAQGRSADAAPWRARAVGLFARVEGRSAERAPGA
jgi:tetratricopeptide (TPR) repeat protein